MRRFSFLLCLALLVSQLGFSVESMAAGWARATTDAMQNIAASAVPGSRCTDCGPAEDSSVLPCEICQLCHGCHSPVLLTGTLGNLVATLAQQLPSTSAVGHVSADNPPDFKPPIL